MDSEIALNLIKNALTRDRFEHTIRVTEVAKKLAEKYHGNIKKIELAALLHDFAKCKPKSELRQSIVSYHLPSQLFEYHHELWHGPVAAEILKREYGLDDQEVLHAIYYHTTGRASMGLTETIVFVADYIEPGRFFSGVEDVRSLVEFDLYAAARKVVANTIQFLMSKGATIYPDTFFAYNDLTKKLGVKND